ncbi:Chs5p-Arf1p-binding proteins-domain-containing protein [Scheffersomyces xylosifermentans]|uniref:Chs5p-Arf1p-binding proteins-domain-containing protein n=1 Tax=Scheffersomyces xylosifermentans TaxID=1304137 RepID=UPI00315DF5FE
MVLPKNNIAGVPMIREAQFGQCLGLRSKLTLQDPQNQNNDVGPPDLCHLGKYAGARSAEYASHEYLGDSLKSSDLKEDDGYVGYYHFVNGLKLANTDSDIEKYVLDIVGVEKVNDSYAFRKENANSHSERFGSLSSSKKELVLTYCSYNVFSKSDFRARYIIHMGSSGKKGTLIHVDSSYQIVPRTGRKVSNFSAVTIRDLNPSYWEELEASQIVRWAHQLDNPSTQLTGLVSYADFVATADELTASVKLLVKFLSRGSFCGFNAGYGTPTACGNNTDYQKKTNYYRNNLSDALIRLCQMDISGNVCVIAVQEVKARYQRPSSSPHEWDYIISKIYKIQRGSNKEHDHLTLLHEHLKSTEIHNTQSGLILLEQVYFLISKESYDLALAIAKKTVQVLPLDFDCWYSLMLCYILVKDYEHALLVMNSMPVTLNNRSKELDLDTISGIRDHFSSAFIRRQNQNEEPISDKAFNLTFPKPIILDDKESSKPLASIQKMWSDLFLFNPHLRHPINGNQFYQSPLMNSSVREVSSVDISMIKICGLKSARNVLASQSAGTPSSSILDFYRKSTWGRCYDMLSLFVALIGWDQVVSLKERVFAGSKAVTTTNVPEQYVVNHKSEKEAYVKCESWLDQLFLIIYEDLRTLMVLATRDNEQQHSAIEWEMLGLLGWTVKYNLRESISSLMTSVLGTSIEGGFDYFATIQLLEIYDDLILSDNVDSTIDLYHDDYDLRFFSNKLILKVSSKTIYNELIKSLEDEYLTLDFVLLNIAKLISWNVRWYQFSPNYLIFRILSKLIIKYDPVVVTTTLKVLFEQNKKHKSRSNKRASKFSLGSLMGGTESNEVERYEFVEDDTICDYVEQVVNWIDALSKTTLTV